MTELEGFVCEQIKTLVPHYDDVSLKATVSMSSFSIEFFATVDGRKMQCFEMIEKGMFTEKDFHTVAKAIANYLRNTPGFHAKGLNKYTVALK